MPVNRVWIQTFLLTLALLTIVACGQSSSIGQPPAGSAQEAAGGEAFDVATLPKNTDGYTDITVQQLAQMLPGKDFTLVNVHIPYQGEIPETDLFVPFNEITEHQDELPVKDEPIVLYCSSGNMSTQAAKALVELGYTKVMEVDGGFSDWAAAGYELIENQSSD
jgi:rhodanese-related sulfurtransferase